MNLIDGLVHWLLAVTIIVYVITGYGIVEHWTVEALTFGLLTKNLSQAIHSNLWLALAILITLVWHVYRRTSTQKRKQAPSGEET